MNDTQRAIVPKIVPEEGAELERFVEAVETHLMPGKKGVDWQKEDLQLFLVKCKVYGLDPFKSHIYALPFKHYDSVTKKTQTTIAFHVSIDGWRVVAARDPRYIGAVSVEWCGTDGLWRDTWFDDDAPSAARVAIARRDTDTLTLAVAHYKTYVKKTREGTPIKFWLEMPDVMLATRAEALGLRRAFPEATEGLSDMGLLGPTEGAEHHIDGEARLIDGETGEIPMTEQEKAKATPEPSPAPPPAEEANSNAAVPAPEIGPEGAATLIQRVKALKIWPEDLGKEMAKLFGEEAILSELTPEQGHTLYDWAKQRAAEREG